MEWYSSFRFISPCNNLLSRKLFLHFSAPFFSLLFQAFSLTFHSYLVHYLLRLSFYLCDLSVPCEIRSWDSLFSSHIGLTPFPPPPIHTIHLLGCQAAICDLWTSALQSSNIWTECSKENVMRQPIFHSKLTEWMRNMLNFLKPYCYNEYSALEIPWSCLSQSRELWKNLGSCFNESWFKWFLSLSLIAFLNISLH